MCTFDKRDSKKQELSPSGCQAGSVTTRRNRDDLLLLGLTVAPVPVGLLASIAPARRDATIDPMQALRSE